jgi:hypothetical protein
MTRAWILTLALVTLAVLPPNGSLSSFGNEPPRSIASPPEHRVLWYAKPASV